MKSVAAVVTGHSRGIGAAIAEHLLSREVRVLGVARHGNSVLAARFGDALQQVELDLADSNALTRWFEGGTLRRFVEEGGAPHTAALVNNAGVLQPIGPLETQEPAAVSQAVAVNVGAALALSAAFVSATSSARDRRILHISSGAGRKAYAGWSVYCASKAALDHHARCVTIDRTPGLRICSVAPGAIDTDMQAEIRASTDQLFPQRYRFVEKKRTGQLLQPDERGRALVSFLLADDFGAEPVAELPG